MAAQKIKLDAFSTEYSETGYSEQAPSLIAINERARQRKRIFENVEKKNAHHHSFDYENEATYIY